jgi:hypothetical protein
MSSAETPTDNQDVACYVYGVVPGDVELTPDAHGLNNREVRLVRHGDLAAMVSDMEVRSAIGRPEDLAAHEQLLDATAVEAPVLPFRFGAVMSDADAVTEHLLAANHDAFAAALKELEGRTEYIVKARYHENAVLSEVLAENEEAARLREQVRGKPEDATRDARMRLGEIIHQVIENKRGADTQALIEVLAHHAVAHALMEPTHDYEAVHVAFLVETSRRSAFEKALEDAAGERRERMAFRLLGPLAAYDFVVTGQ